jgi:hypothetical protein
LAPKGHWGQKWRFAVIFVFEKAILCSNFYFPLNFFLLMIADNADYVN